MKVLRIIIGVVLLITGIWCLFTPFSTYLSIAWILGFVMLFEGVMSIVTYCMTHKQNAMVTGWDLFEGIITSIFALIILSHQLLTDVMLPYCFGVWMMVSGVTRIVEAFKKKSVTQKSKIWIALLVVGILCILVGIYALFHPILAAFSLGVLIGFILIMQGINFITFETGVDR